MKNRMPGGIAIAVSVLMSTLGTGRAMADHAGLDVVGKYVVAEGTLEVVQQDDFNLKKVSRTYFIKVNEKEAPYELRFNGKPRHDLKSGMYVRVRGQEAGNEIINVDSTNDLEVIAMDVAAPSGARKSVVLIVKFRCDADPANNAADVSCSDADIESRIYTGALSSGLSVNGWYNEISSGITTFPPQDLNAPAGPDVFRIEIPNCKNETCGYSTWSAAADTAAANLGISLSSYQHRIYVLPSGTATGNCAGWAGVGNVGCASTCRTWVWTCNLPDVFTHELGHNVEMAHSSTDTNNDTVIDSEYGDTSDFMGYGGVGYRHVNAPHMEQMGWAGARYASAGTGGTFTIEAVDKVGQPSDLGLPIAVKVPKADTPGRSYYVSYRQAYGQYDGNLSSSYAQKVSVHTYTSGYSNTLLVATLSDAAGSNTFSDATNGVSIVFNSKNTVDGTASVTVSTTCTANTPNVTLSPATVSGKGGTARSFTMTVTNTDSAACSSSTFNLSGAVPSGWTGGVSPAALTIAAGGSGSATFTVTPPLSVTDGSYTVTATANDPSVGAHVKSANGTYSVDNTPPPAPTSLTVSLNRQKKPVLSWSGNAQSAKYHIFRGSSTSGTTAPTSFTEIPNASGVVTTSYTDTGSLTAGLYYWYYVKAEDGAGNVSGASNYGIVLIPRKGGK